MAFRAKGQKVEPGEVELLRSLVRLANLLQSSLELDDIVHVIATALSETFGFREAAVYLAEPDGVTFRLHATVGQHPEIDRELFARPVPRSVLDELFLAKYQIGSSYFIDHRQHEWTEEQLYVFPCFDLGERAPGDFHPDDAFLVPMHDKRRELMGVLDLYDPKDRALPTLDLVKSLEVFATHSAVAIENARQYEQLEHTKAQLESQLSLRHSLLELSSTLLATLDPDVVFVEAGAMLREIVDYDSMEIRLVDEDAGQLFCAYASDEELEHMAKWRSSVDEGVSGWVVRHNEAQLVNDMINDPRGALVPGTEPDPQASIIVPLRVGGEVIGVLALDRNGGWLFEESELEPAQLFGNLAAIAIQNARSYEAMQHQAISDGLTGIHNYRHFHETLAAEVNRAGRYDEVFCLLMMDLDHFKAVNDTIGHQKGDDVLRAVADVLRRCSRASDYLARYGGEEFTMILPRTGLVEARTLAERIRQQVEQLDTAHGDISVTMSIGVASYPESALDSDGVLGAADAALLRAKAGGRNRVRLHDEPQGAVLADAAGELVTLGRRFAAFVGLDEAETAGLLTALAVVESGGALQDEVQTVLGRGENGGAGLKEVRRSAVDALIYGNERWDGSGYPEGRRGCSIPRVARAFAVCRGYEAAAQNGETIEVLRSQAARELDPSMVQRLAAMLRGDEAERRMASSGRN